MTTPTTVVDLRQYALLPGRRDALIELFDRHLAPGQQAAGIHVVGQFRDLDDPDQSPLQQLRLRPTDHSQLR